MSSRKLRVESVKVDHPLTTKGTTITELTIRFSRKLTQLEVSGVRAVLDGEIK